MQAEVMNNTHPEWDEFMNKLGAMVECDGCNHTHQAAKHILDIFYPDANPDRSIEHFKSKGGFCDCEILLNVYRPVPENIEPLLNELRY